MWCPMEQLRFGADNPLPLAPASEHFKSDVALPQMDDLPARGSISRRRSLRPRRSRRLRSSCTDERRSSRARACEDPLETPPIRVSAGAVSRWEGLAKRLAKRSRGRAMDTRTIASVALVIAVVIVVILFVL
jgi:hypothetical protein